MLRKLSSLVGEGSLNGSIDFIKSIIRIPRPYTDHEKWHRQAT